MKIQTLIILASVTMIGACASTHIKDKTVEKYYESGQLKKRVVVKGAGNANFFKDTKFDNLTAAAGGANIEGKTYTGTVNGDAIEKTGGAVGTVVGKAVQAAATIS